LGTLTGMPSIVNRTVSFGKSAICHFVKRRSYPVALK
jgi:hypothetical protein